MNERSAKHERQLREVGIVGLGRIGGGLARQARQKGLHVVGYDRRGVSSALRDCGVVDAVSLGGFKQRLRAPRLVLLYVPSGDVVDEVLDSLACTLEPGDVIADGGNSYWGDSLRRHARLEKPRLHFLDVGTSGGVEGAESGACFMAGGDRAAIDIAEPVLETLAVAGGYAHVGPPGAGHFTKLVHNGIEFGMLQSIAEGVSLLERSRDCFENVDLPGVLRCWRHGSVIRSWLIDLMERAYREHDGLDVPAHVEDTGEVNWLVADALRFEVPIPVITQSVLQLFASRDLAQTAPRAIAMMRHGFGGHPFGRDASLAKKRRESRVGPIYVGSGGQCSR